MARRRFARIFSRSLSARSFFLTDDAGRQHARGDGDGKHNERREEIFRDGKIEIIIRKGKDEINGESSGEGGDDARHPAVRV